MAKKKVFFWALHRDKEWLSVGESLHPNKARETHTLLFQLMVKKQAESGGHNLQLALLDFELNLKECARAWRIARGLCSSHYVGKVWQKIGSFEVVRFCLFVFFSL